jgi:8-amino-7-oxononanoate synthase
MSPHTLATIKVTYEYLFTEQKAMQEQNALLNNISCFRSGIIAYVLKAYFIKSTSAIQSCVISGNSAVKALAKQLQKGGYDVRAILSPTVASGNERLRFCIHSYNTAAQINDVLRLLSTFV